MWTDPAALLAGPRGRRLCWALLEDQLPPSFRVSVWRGGAGGDPDRAVPVLDRALESADLAGLRATAEPTAFLPALADAVGAAMYWQPPDETDQLLADRAVSDALFPVAAAVAAAPGAVWWGEPLARDEQYEVDFTGVRGSVDRSQDVVRLGTIAPGPDAGGPDPSRQGAAPVPVACARVPLERWRAAMLADEAAAATRPADPRANWTGFWWSTPGCPGIPSSTRGLGAGGPVGLTLVEDDPGSASARCRRLRPHPAARVFEINRPEDFAELVRRHPLPVPRSRRHDWWRTTGQNCDWAIPDYLAVAEEYDAVHLSALGYLSTAGRALPLGRVVPLGRRSRAGRPSPPDAPGPPGRNARLAHPFRIPRTSALTAPDLLGFPSQPTRPRRCSPAGTPI